VDEDAQRDSVTNSLLPIAFQESRTNSPVRVYDILICVKSKVYIETSVVSYLTGRPSRDLVIAAHQELTRQWWEERAGQFVLVISELVQQEARRGDLEASRVRVTALDGIDILRVNDEAVSLAERLVLAELVPKESAADALHIAIAAVHGIDYLLTWNCRHLANASRRSRIEAFIKDSGFVSAVICTPEELMEE
jgi:predicted nucleic acid-binding protein